MVVMVSYLCLTVRWHTEPKMAVWGNTKQPQYFFFLLSAFRQTTVDYKLQLVLLTSVEQCGVMGQCEG